MDSEMTGRIKINIRYTLRDFRDFCFAKVYGNVFRKILLIPTVLILLLMIICFPVALFAFNDDPQLLLLLALLFVYAIVFFLILELMPFLIMYLRYRSNYRKSKLLQSLQCIEVSKDEFVISSIEGSTVRHWNEVYKVQEFRPCFLVYESFAKMVIIPKRCFVSQEQLDDFRDILKSAVQKNKLKLKKYILKKSFPDYGEIEEANLNISGLAGENIEETPELVLEFTLEKRDALAINFLVFYTKPAGIMFTLLGLFLIVSNVMQFGTIDSYNFTTVVGLIFGVFFVFGFPLLLFINSGRAYSNDPLLKKTTKYKIFRDYYIVEHPSSVSRIEWTKLVKVAETKSAFLFYITTQLVHIIPKRVFEGKEDDLLKLKDIITGYRSNKLPKRPRN